MIAYLQGVVLFLETKSIVLDVSGVGYRVIIGQAVKEKLRIGDVLKLYIYHHVSDSEQSLFGFISEEEIHYFELLLKVPSVGPRTAMNILDAAPAAVLAQAVYQNDLSLLTAISGIGRRTAERIVVELKGKVAFIETATTKTMPGKLQQEVVEVLVAMGIKPAQAKATAQKLPADIVTVEEAVKAALKTS